MILADSLPLPSGAQPAPRTSPAPADVFVPPVRATCMNATFAAGAALTVVGVAAYVVGVARPFPGRSFSVAAVMIGISLLAVSGRQEGEL